MDQCIEREDYALFEILQDVTKDKYIMLNRQPTLHRMGLLAFKINVNKDYVIRIHPLVCEPYNADFDGDQMAAYLPLYPNTQDECHRKLSVESNLISPSTGDLVLGINQDMVLGLYLLTKPEPGKECEVDGIKTYEGRVRFNDLLPDDFPFVNRTISKRELKAVMNVITKRYPYDQVKVLLDRIKEFGFRETTIRGTTLSLKNMDFPESYAAVSEICDNTSTTVREKFFKLENHEMKADIKNRFPYYDFIESGSRGSWDQANQLIYSRGFVSNFEGKVIEQPIKNNLINGLTRQEYFTSSYGSRKALLDVALNTGVSGYLTRKLVYCCVNLEIDDSIEDCGTEEGLVIQIPAEKTYDLDNVKLAKSLLNRWVRYNREEEYFLVTHENCRDLIGKELLVRSPIFCTNTKLCKKCYGTLVEDLHSKYVGIIAAQAAGEVATQLTLRTFHLGGIAKMAEEGEGDGQQDIINDLAAVKKMLHANTKHSYNNLILELFKIYSNHRLLLLVHFECIVAQMMRAEDGGRWRLGEDRKLSEVDMVSIENVPSKESFLLALAFAKPYVYLVSGILGSSVTTDGVLEKIMLNKI